MARLPSVRRRRLEAEPASPAGRRRLCHALGGGALPAGPAQVPLQRARLPVDFDLDAHGDILFNLESALQLHDAVQERIAAYEARLLEEIRALQPQERREQPVPTHPNPAKEKAMRGRGATSRRARSCGAWRGSI